MSFTLYTSHTPCSYLIPSIPTYTHIHTLYTHIYIYIYTHTHTLICIHTAPLYTPPCAPPYSKYTPLYIPPVPPPDRSGGQEGRRREKLCRQPGECIGPPSCLYLLPLLPLVLPLLPLPLLSTYISIHLYKSLSSSPVSSFFFSLFNPFPPNPDRLPSPQPKAKLNALKGVNKQGKKARGAKLQQRQTLIFICMFLLLYIYILCLLYIYILCIYIHSQYISMYTSIYIYI